MAEVLITGMSGTGKSTVLAELARRGHRTVDTDEDGWSEEVPLPGGGMEQRWREAPMNRLMAGTNLTTCCSWPAASPTRSTSTTGSTSWCCSVPPGR